MCVASHGCLLLFLLAQATAGISGCLLCSEAPHRTSLLALAQVPFEAHGKGTCDKTGHGLGVCPCKEPCNGILAQG